MIFTRHARDRMKERRISQSELKAALSKGSEKWGHRAIVVMHGTIRVVICPFTGCIITAYRTGKPHRWKRRGRVKKGD